MNAAKPHSPWLSLVTLLGFTFVGALASQIVVIVLFALFSGKFDISSLGNPLSLAESNRSLLYLLLASSSLGTFLFPAILLQRLERDQFNYFPSRDMRLNLFLGLSFLFLLAASPIMELISRWNMEMSLPESLVGVETWMRTQEDAMAELTKSLVMVDSPRWLIVNILVMAVIPAIVEEFFFRGALQNICFRIFGNQHAAIWITAIIFSAIHVQFFGFFPRMILGLIFGYAFVWTKNIWVPVFAHFVNNATVTIIAFTFHKQGKTYDDLQSADVYSPIIYLTSFIAALLIGYYFYKKSQEVNRLDESELD
ncbi:CPBP family intramembrane glutamic endopeptidase [Sphingobacterium sp. BN32]|uniref:CPBP family intramembrane glutamic endopeptidase n=1 Tax=Sphingobacterium sp. BN32 TaxID=3058432 RepID=UPI00265D3DDD|nr:CPBP family intramembrane glutamic endopeptidase [Sphingobacterium sp. BN32]WKK58603.1 CPBP family intramembrane metalloprotease [Sphingobacterium sp. BN32]